MATLHHLECVVIALEQHGCRVVRQSTTKVRAQCPAHPDKRPSLAIDLRDETLLLHCFAGCRTLEVLQALGLTWSDLGHDRPASAPPTPASSAAEYLYCDLDGRVQARKVRFVPKAFCWERPDHATTSPRWRKGLAGLKPLLYGIEYVIDVKRVVVVEGEKAVEFLRSLGIVAVCPPVGAGVWNPAMTELLWRAGCHEVVVLVDADREGRRHAATVVGICYGWRPDLSETVVDDPWREIRLAAGDYEAEPLVVRRLELPDLNHHEDVVDWLTSHRHSVAELHVLIDGVEPWTPVDPAERRRILTRERVRRFRARQREGSTQPVTRERSVLIEL